MVAIPGIQFSWYIPKKPFFSFFLFEELHFVLFCAACLCDAFVSVLLFLRWPGPNKSNFGLLLCLSGAMWATQRGHSVEPDWYCFRWNFRILNRIANPFYIFNQFMKYLKCLFFNDSPMSCVASFDAQPVNGWNIHLKPDPELGRSKFDIYIYVAPLLCLFGHFHPGLSLWGGEEGEWIEGGGAVR